MRTHSADGVALHGVHLRGAAAVGATDRAAGAPDRPTRGVGSPDSAHRTPRLGAAVDGGTALVVCHGFTHHTAHPGTRRVLDALARGAGIAGVVALDLRGHGRSGGCSSVGETEVLDVDAAVALARAAGYVRVVTVGFSLGAAVALRHAAGELGVTRPDRVVAVSGPSRWYVRDTAAMRRVHWLLEQPHGRLAARALGTRLDLPWEVVPPSPVEVVPAIAPIPLLIVHGDRDEYFAVDHARALAAASDGHAELWLEHGAGHGESGTGDALALRIAAWASCGASTGRLHGHSTSARPPC